MGNPKIRSFESLYKEIVGTSFNLHHIYHGPHDPSPRSSWGYLCASPSGRPALLAHGLFMVNERGMPKLFRFRRVSVSKEARRSDTSLPHTIDADDKILKLCFCIYPLSFELLVWLSWVDNSLLGISSCLFFSRISSRG